MLCPTRFKKERRFGRLQLLRRIPSTHCRFIVVYAPYPFPCYMLHGGRGRMLYCYLIYLPNDRVGVLSVKGNDSTYYLPLSLLFHLDQFSSHLVSELKRLIAYLPFRHVHSYSYSRPRAKLQSTAPCVLQFSESL